MAEKTSLNERADALERKMSDELDVLLSKSALFNMADGQLGASGMGSDLTTKHGKYYLMDDDPRLPKMPAKPTLLDYFTYRAKGINHLLQSATHALKASMPEKTILACLLHDKWPDALWLWFLTVPGPLYAFVVGLRWESRSSGRN